MSINTSLYILLYKENKLIYPIHINTLSYRLDDGIGYHVWDINTQNKESKAQFIADYNLTEEEFNLLQFSYYFVDDLSEETGEDSWEINFNKIPVSSLTKASKLSAIIEKIFINEKRLIRNSIKTLSSEFQLQKEKVGKDLNVSFGELEKQIFELLNQKFNTNYDSISFINLLGILRGALLTIPDDLDIKVITYAA